MIVLVRSLVIIWTTHSREEGKMKIQEDKRARKCKLSMQITRPGLETSTCRTVTQPFPVYSDAKVDQCPP